MSGMSAGLDSEHIFQVGDLVVRRREPKGQIRNEPLVGEIVAIFGTGPLGTSEAAPEKAKPAKARVRWCGGVNRWAKGRTDNHTALKLSALLPATKENLQRARAHYRERWLKYLKGSARHYEKLAAQCEERGDEQGACWAQQEAVRWRRAHLVEISDEEGAPEKGEKEVL